MSSKSLPPYDEYDRASPPLYFREESSISDHGLTLPDTTEVYRATFPHYLLASPIDALPVAGNSIAHVNVVISTNTKGVGMTPESTLTVHSSTDKASTPIGRVKISNSPTTDLTIYKNPDSVTSSESQVSHTKFTIRGTSGYSFEFARDARGVKEHFQWVQSPSNEHVKALAQINVGREDYSRADHGWKLVTTTSDAIHAVYVSGQNNWRLNPRRVMAKLRFLQTKQSSPLQHNAEKTWRLLVALSVLGMVEQERQSGVQTSGLLFYCTVLSRVESFRADQSDIVKQVREKLTDKTRWGLGSYLVYFDQLADYSERWELT